MKQVWNWLMDESQRLATLRDNRQLALAVATGEKAKLQVVTVKMLREERKRPGREFWLEPPAHSEDEVVAHYEAAWKAWRAGRGQLPTRKGRYSRDSFTVASPKKGLKLEKWRVCVIGSDLGWLRLKESMPLDFDAREATIFRDAHKWFVSISIVRHHDIQPKVGTNVIGVDRGVKVMAMASDGIAIENPRALSAEEKRLRRAQRRLARQKKGSRSRFRTKQEIQRIHYRVASVRKNAQHVGTTALVRRADVVVLEDLDSKGMIAEGGKRKRGLNRALADAGMSEIGRQLRYKAEWNGARVVEYPRFERSTQRCSSCGRDVDVVLAQRTFRCPCGLVMDRDLNAAKVLQSYGEQQLAASTGPAVHSGPTETNPSGLGSATERGVQLAQAGGAPL